MIEFPNKNRLLKLGASFLGRRVLTTADLSLDYCMYSKCMTTEFDRPLTSLPLLPITHTRPRRTLPALSHFNVPYHPSTPSLHYPPSPTPDSRCSHPPPPAPSPLPSPHSFTLYFTDVWICGHIIFK